MRKYCLVKVKWEDASGQGSWQTLEEARESELATIETCGYIVKTDAHKVVVVGSLDNRGLCMDRNTISKRCIISITRLEKEK